MERGMKEGISYGSMGVGKKGEGKVPLGSDSVETAMHLSTAGLMGANGLGKHNFKEGNHNKGGGKVELRSDRPYPKDKPKFRRT